MAALDHWNPVLLSRELKQKPVCIRLDGREIAVYRESTGRVGLFRRGKRRASGWRYSCESHASSKLTRYDERGPHVEKLFDSVAAGSTADIRGNTWATRCRDRGGGHLATRSDCQETVWTEYRGLWADSQCESTVGGIDRAKRTWYDQALPSPFECGFAIASSLSAGPSSDGRAYVL